MPIQPSTIIEFLGLLLGPLSAVFLTFGVERRRRESDAKVEVMRSLLTSRADITDPSFQHAINSVPLVFKGDQKVLAAWVDFMASVNRQPSNAAELAVLQNDWRDAQIELCKALLRSVRFGDVDVSTIATAAYSPQAAVEDRDRRRAAMLGIVEAARGIHRLGDINESILTRAGAAPAQSGESA